MSCAVTVHACLGIDDEPYLDMWCRTHKMWLHSARELATLASINALNARIYEHEQDWKET